MHQNDVHMVRCTTTLKDETRNFIIKQAKKQNRSFDAQCSLYLDEKVAQEKENKKKVKEPEIIRALNE